MKQTSTNFAMACAALAALCIGAGSAHAQCNTCAVPQVAYSPVVYNTYTTYDGWYLGKYLGRLGQRVFGPAPAAAYQAAYPATYAASYPATYAASYAPTYGYASYAPSCSTCNTQTTYRPVIMQPLTSCSTCYAPTCSTCNTCNSCDTCSSCGTCDTCSGVTQATYESSVSSCPTCQTSSYVQSDSASTAPSLPSGSAAPPQTFRETDRIDPIPANENSVEGQSAEFSAPMLLDPHDKLTKRPTAPVWTAVYKRPATITSVSATPKATTASKPAVGWTSGR